MIPTGLFRSRWAALAWAAGILWLAHDVATSAPAATGNTAGAAGPEDAMGDRVDPASLAVLANAAPD